MWNALLKAFYNKFTPFDASPNTSVLGDLLNLSLGEIVVRGTYSFEVNGGAQAAHSLKDLDGKDIIIPANAILLGALVDGRSEPTSGGDATIALGIVGAPDAILAAEDYDNGEFDGVNALSVTPAKLAGGRLIATVAAANLTAGIFDVYVKYSLGLADPA